MIKNICGINVRFIFVKIKRTITSWNAICTIEEVKLCESLDGVSIKLFAVNRLPRCLILQSQTQAIQASRIDQSWPFSDTIIFTDGFFSEILCAFLWKKEINLQMGSEIEDDNSRR